jgi:hypothetical protein
MFLQLSCGSLFFRTTFAVELLLVSTDFIPRLIYSKADWYLESDPVCFSGHVLTSSHY